MNYEVLSPLAHRSELVLPTERIEVESAPKSIAFVWHYGYRGDEMFAGVAEMYGARHEGSVFHGHETFGNIHGADERRIIEELPAKLRSLDVDAVVLGVGG